MNVRPWPRGSATGIGSLPGTDSLDAAITVFGELPDLPHLVELPERGAGADMIGRGALFLADLPVQIEPSGWRFARHPGIDQRRARDFLARDLDALEQAGRSWTGPLKIQAPGPVTLAASIELATGHRAISDAGALSEIAESLHEGLLQHLADLRNRLPGANLVVQLDEPSVPAALAAHLPTASGWGTLRAVKPEIVVQRIATVLDVAEPGARVVHCCAADAPIEIFRRAGADAVAVDMDLLTTAATDALGEAVDAGMSLWLGLVRASGPVPMPAAVVDRVVRFWDRLGFDPSVMADTVVITPACGLGTATGDVARQAMTVVRHASERLREQ